MFETIRIRLAKTVMLAGMIMSLISITGNLIIRFPLEMSIKWVLLLVISGLNYLYYRRNGFKEKPVFIMFCFFVFALIPFGYIDSGGASNNTIGYIFLLLISITYLFKGRKRIFLAMSLILVFITMHNIEYFHPEIFPAYDEKSLYIDRLLQIPVILIMSYFTIYAFSNDYEKITDKLYYAANYDELTRLHNRRVFNTILEESVKNPKENSFLILFDIDNFKQVNDDHGHHEGDSLLKDFGDIMREIFPEGNNTLSRWGGDEFAMLFTGSEKTLAERMDALKDRFDLRAESYDHDMGISFGWTKILPGADVDKILIDADTNLYKHKRGNK